MPGVLIIEAMAQAAAVLSFKTLDVRPDPDSVYYFAGIDNCTLQAPGRAGRPTDHRVEIAGRPCAASASTRRVARVDGQLAAEAELMCAIKTAMSLAIPDCHRPSGRGSVPAWRSAPMR
jgi:3-hydroxyacyl-[acyl-carrier-protein] dehydratase